MRWRRHPVVSMDAGRHALSTQAWSAVDVPALATFALSVLRALCPLPLAQPLFTTLIATAKIPDHALVRLAAASRIMGFQRRMMGEYSVSAVTWSSLVSSCAGLPEVLSLPPLADS